MGENNSQSSDRSDERHFIDGHKDLIVHLAGPFSAVKAARLQSTSESDGNQIEVVRGPIKPASTSLSRETFHSEASHLLQATEATDDADDEAAIDIDQLAFTSSPDATVSD